MDWYTYTYYTKKAGRLNQTLLSKLVCTHVRGVGLIAVLVLKVIVRQKVQPQFKVCTCHRLSTKTTLYKRSLKIKTLQNPVFSFLMCFCTILFTSFFLEMRLLLHSTGTSMREVVLLVISQQHFPHTFEYFPIDTWLHSKARSQEGLKTALKIIDLAAHAR